MQNAPAYSIATFDPRALLALRIPEVRQSVAERDAILYALSVGMGQDPQDERQLDFLHEARPLKTMPSAAVVFCHPGFWLAEPRTGVDPSAILHGEQEIEIFAPLPARGALLGQTRVTGVADKGPGRGVLVFTEKTIVDASDGRLLAKTRMTTFLKGYGGHDRPEGPPPVRIPGPEGPADRTIDLPTRPEQALLYRLNGDPNPLHVEPRLAVRHGFDRPILHGLCTFGVICHALLKGVADYDATRLRRMRLRFTAPVFPGETIRTEIWRSGFFKARVVERDVVVADGGQFEIHDA